jgi:hypothetical protein
VLLPPLHIKLGLGKNCEEALDKNGPALSFLCEKFPKLNVERIEADAFIGLEIRQLFTDTQFDLAVCDDEKAAWNAFRQNVTPPPPIFFKGNVKATTSGSLWKNL